MLLSATQPFAYVHVCTVPVYMSQLGEYRESSHGIKELFNLSSLVLKARHLSGSAPFAEITFA